MNNQPDEQPDNSALSRTNDAPGLIDRNARRRQGAEETKRRFLDGLPEDLRESVEELLAKLAGAEDHNSFFGLGVDLNLLQMRVAAQVSDIWKRSELLGVIALIEPFVLLFDAENDLAALEHNAQRKFIIDPSSRLSNIASCVNRVKAALTSERPYNDAAVDNLKTRVNELDQSAQEIRVEAYKSYLNAALSRLESNLGSGGNIHRDMGEVFKALEVLRNNGISLDNPTTVKEQLEKGHAVLLEQANEARRKIDDEPSLKGKPEIVE